ncbi:MAG: P-type conjugative transfer protein TrbJ [Candidatus Accumulibacter sp.]|jgi:P-type conjugative transfer protein TrbJ|nr:P-type conjugative transfer protein TrbJ [Accumulibacter sp.]
MQRFQAFKYELMPNVEQAQATMNNLTQATNTLNMYNQQLGSLEAYLSKFQDINHYTSASCLAPGKGCSAAEIEALKQSRDFSSEAQKKANDGVIRGLEKQFANLSKDAATLQQLQSAATSAGGRMQALQYANQLASHQSHQLLQIRAMLAAQHNAAMTRQQAELNKEAQQEAASRQFRRSNFKPSPEVVW